ncbi:MAG: hypothetical protein ACLQGV_10960 [Bryobacteraceae bacterium]
MPSQRQIEANRRNALRSTGPRTPQGKYIAARNHTLHGFSSPDPLLPDEDPAEFAASLAKWRNYCQPAGPHQEELVAYSGEADHDSGMMPIGIPA